MRLQIVSLISQVFKKKLDKIKNWCLEFFEHTYSPVNIFKWLGWIVKAIIIAQNHKIIKELSN